MSLFLDSGKNNGKKKKSDIENAGKTRQLSNTNLPYNKRKLNRKSEKETRRNQKEVSVINRMARNPPTKVVKKLASSVVHGLLLLLLLLLLLFNCFFCTLSSVDPE